MIYGNSGKHRCKKLIPSCCTVFLGKHRYRLKPNAAWSTFRTTYFSQTEVKATSRALLPTKNTPHRPGTLEQGERKLTITRIILQIRFDWLAACSQTHSCVLPSKHHGPHQQKPLRQTSATLQTRKPSHLPSPREQQRRQAKRTWWQDISAYVHGFPHWVIFRASKEDSIHGPWFLAAKSELVKCSHNMPHAKNLSWHPPWHRGCCQAHQ